MMSNSRDEFKKSELNIELKFDKGREEDFKIILNEKFGIKAKSGGNDLKTEDIGKLEKDFNYRENEIQKFRQKSQNAVYAPLLTQAMVKKARIYTASVQV